MPTNFLPGYFSLLAILLVLNSYAQKPEGNFWPVKGTVKTHLFTESEDSLWYEMFEVDDGKRMPRWFYRDVLKSVCLTGECRMIHVLVLWDAVGNYLRLQLHENEPFSKTNHSVFQPEDYQKLHKILSDPNSILKNMKQEDLIVQPKSNEALIDGYSGATQESLKAYLVEKAAYTCYTLWHTVYGDSGTEILNLIEQQADSAYLQLLLDQNHPGYTVWSIAFIKRHPEYHATFYPQIINQIKNKDNNVAQKAFSYFDSELLKTPAIQIALASIFDEISYQLKFDFLWKLASVKIVTDEVVLQLLELFEDQKITISMASYIFKLIQANNLDNPLIVSKLKAFQQHENLYIRNLTQNVFSKAEN